MPYFSFSINDTKNIHLQNFEKDVQNIAINKKYFSKNTYLWKLLNSKKTIKDLNFIKYEQRIKIKDLKKKVLFCLPPSIGLGDAVEYALSLKAVLNSNKFDVVGVAFVGRYKKIFKKYFKFVKIYENIISNDDFITFDTIFHITAEIKDLKYQKYDRKNIESLITSFFKVDKYRKILTPKTINKKIITIFPISQSPIRSMPLNLLADIIKAFYNNAKVEIILDRESQISNYIEKNSNFNEVRVLYPKNLNDLLKIIENISFGIFMDSGPLHVAKILNKRGVLIISSVSGKILLNDFSNIISINNNYESKYCKSPCGLVNIFNLNNRVGCYDSLKVQKNILMKDSSLNSLQRGNLKNKYINFISNPVNCLRNISSQNLIKEIKEYLLK